ncbi:MAG: hypothetical protein HUJ31_16805, partial [Pseudomonadales bacterium]|nr:hypothetical protein [Pseudomonadales bacterium]
MIRGFWFLLLMTVVCSTGADTMPGDSVYRLDTPMTTQNGEEISLSVYEGHPV